MNVKRLDGRQLNYWVALSAGLRLSEQQPAPRHDPDSGVWHPHTYNPANDWSQAGAILADEWFRIEDALVAWFGEQWPHVPAVSDNPLKWFMRAYVATQFGDEVEDIAVLPGAPQPLALATPDRAGSGRAQASAWDWLWPINW